MKIHFFTAPFYFAFIWFRVQGSGSRGGFAAPKGSQPRLAALGSSFQGKGLAWILPPSYGRRCPEGAEVGWGKRDEKDRGDRLKYAIYESAAIPDTQPSPRGEGGERSEPDRGLAA